MQRKEKVMYHDAHQNDRLEYEKPLLRFLGLDFEDIITTSGNESGGGSDDTGSQIPDWTGPWDTDLD